LKTAIITGCNGLIGSQSVSFFHEKGYRVVGIDNDMRSYFFGEDASTVSTEKALLDSFENFEIHHLDIRDYESMKLIFSENADSIEIIIHTAAQPSHDWAVKEPLTDFGVNAVGTINLLELTRQYCPNASFIFTSTNKVYGDKPNRESGLVESEKRYQLYDSNGNLKSIDENMSIDDSLHSVFGASKVAADIMVQEYGKYFKMKTVCFRGGCLTGPNHRGAELHGFLSYLIKCIINRKPYTIYGYKGKQVRDNIHSWDLVNMFWHYHQNPKSGVVYNAGGGQENSTSILEAIDLVNAICKKKDSSWEEWKDYKISEESRIGDHIFYTTDLRKFKRDYPSWPGITISLENLIEEMTNNELKK
jgi:CDP-paratose 2-epimerase